MEEAKATLPTYDLEMGKIYVVPEKAYESSQIWYYMESKGFASHTIAPRRCEGNGASRRRPSSS